MAQEATSSSTPKSFGNARPATQMQRTGWVIDPRASQFMRNWDLVMAFALLFTAVVTPVEVAFLDEGRYITPLWIINRVVDTCFTVDVVITFNLAYQATPGQGGHWVMNKKFIALHYLQGWFTIDIISIVPFYLITLDWSDPLNQQTDDAAGTGRVAQLRATSLVRIIKLLRMIKLARLLKASRVIQRNFLDVVMNKWEWTFAVIKMIKLVVLLLVFAHFQACLYGVVTSFLSEDGSAEPNWITSFDSQFAATMGYEPAPLDRYVAALYWSVMTLTSIGYGEFTPENTTERALCSLYMMMSGVMWTYAIGSVASIATTLFPETIVYENTMDTLNHFMRERKLTKPMRIALREYFAQSRKIHSTSDDGALLRLLSPLLQGTVALAANKQWMDHVWYLRSMVRFREGVEFISGAAKQLVPRTYVAHERVPVGQLCILKRGYVVKNWHFLGLGRVWGEDLIIDTPELIDHAQAVCLTYVETYTLRKADIATLCHEFPKAGEVIEKAAKRIKIQRRLIKAMCHASGKGSPMSFCPKSASSGVSEVPDVMSLDQKLDRLLQQRQVDVQCNAVHLEPADASRSMQSGTNEHSTLVAMMLESKAEVADVKKDIAELKEMMRSLLGSQKAV